MHLTMTVAARVSPTVIIKRTATNAASSLVHWTLVHRYQNLYGLIFIFNFVCDYGIEDRLLIALRDLLWANKLIVCIIR